MGQDDRNARARGLGIDAGVGLVWVTFSCRHRGLTSFSAPPGAKANRKSNDQCVNHHSKGCGVINTLQAEIQRVR